MQQGHTTTRLVAAATSCVCTEFRNGEPTSMHVKLILDPFTALSTSCLIVDNITTTYSPKKTPVAHYLTIQRRVQFAT